MKAKSLLPTGGRYSRSLSKFMEPGKVLDIGTVAGCILKGLSEDGGMDWDLSPTHPWQNMAAQNWGVDIEVGALEQYKKRRNV